MRLRRRRSTESHGAPRRQKGASSGLGRPLRGAGLGASEAAFPDAGIGLLHEVLPQLLLQRLLIDGLWLPQQARNLTRAEDAAAGPQPGASWLPSPEAVHSDVRVTHIMWRVGSTLGAMSTNRAGQRAWDTGCPCHEAELSILSAEIWQGITCSSIQHAPTAQNQTGDEVHLPQQRVDRTSGGEI